MTTDAGVRMGATREAYGPTLIKLAEAGHDVVAIDADLPPIGADVNADGVADISWDVDLVDGDWSYLYLLSDVSGQTLDSALHHVRGADIVFTLPN